MLQTSMRGGTLLAAVLILAGCESKEGEGVDGHLEQTGNTLTNRTAGGSVAIQPSQPRQAPKTSSGSLVEQGVQKGSTESAPTKTNLKATRKLEAP